MEWKREDQSVDDPILRARIENESFSSNREYAMADTPEYEKRKRFLLSRLACRSGRTYDEDFLSCNADHEDIAFSTIPIVEARTQQDGNRGEPSTQKTNMLNQSDREDPSTEAKGFVTGTTTENSLSRKPRNHQARSFVTVTPNENSLSFKDEDLENHWEPRGQEWIHFNDQPIAGDTFCITGCAATGMLKLSNAQVNDCCGEEPEDMNESNSILWSDSNVSSSTCDTNSAIRTKSTKQSYYSDTWTDDDCTTLSTSTVSRKGRRARNQSQATASTKGSHVFSAFGGGQIPTNTSRGSQSIAKPNSAATQKIGCEEAEERGITGNNNVLRSNISSFTSETESAIRRRHKRVAYLLSDTSRYDDISAWSSRTVSGNGSRYKLSNWIREENLTKKSSSVEDRQNTSAFTGQGQKSDHESIRTETLVSLSSFGSNSQSTTSNFTPMVRSESLNYLTSEGSEFWADASGEQSIHSEASSKSSYSTTPGTHQKVEPKIFLFSSKTFDESQSDTATVPCTTSSLPSMNSTNESATTISTVKLKTPKKLRRVRFQLPEETPSVRKEGLTGCWAFGASDEYGVFGSPSDRKEGSSTGCLRFGLGGDST